MALEERRANIERLMAGSGNGNLASCAACGSLHFYSVTVEQFSKGFGSVEYTNVSTNPRSVKICLCGTPLPSKAVTRGGVNPDIRAVQESFYQSLNGAVNYIQENSARHVAKNAATPGELEELKSQLLVKIAELEDKINTIEHTKEHKEVVKEKEPKVK